MSAKQVVRVTLLRERDRSCSSCASSVTVGVKIQADRTTAQLHFLFCRSCAQRIGVVGSTIGKARRLLQRTQGG